MHQHINNSYILFLFLTSCSVSSLYQTKPITQNTTDCVQIKINSKNDRLHQQLRNHLLYLFNKYNWNTNIKIIEINFNLKCDNKKFSYTDALTFQKELVTFSCPCNINVYYDDTSNYYIKTTKAHSISHTQMNDMSKTKKDRAQKQGHYIDGTMKNCITTTTNNDMSKTINNCIHTTKNNGITIQNNITTEANKINNLIQLNSINQDNKTKNNNQTRNIPKNSQFSYEIIESISLNTSTPDAKIIMFNKNFNFILKTIAEKIFTQFIFEMKKNNIDNSSH